MFVTYANTLYATNYFNTKLSWQVVPWTNASAQDKINALLEASRVIDTLNYVGLKYDPSFDDSGLPNQINEFPRGPYPTVPDAICQAACEIALKLLDGVDLDLEAENIPNNATTISAARVARDISATQEHVRAGIPSIRAWLLIKAYLVDPRTPIMSRGGTEPGLGDSPTGTSVVQGFNL